jgi:hypothetical protein
MVAAPESRNGPSVDQGSTASRPGRSSAWATAVSSAGERSGSRIDTVLAVPVVARPVRNASSSSRATNQGRFVGRPATTVSSRAVRNVATAARRSAPWATILASNGS